MLDKRKRDILTAIVEMHVQTGEPVGSKLISLALGSKISPATIRNEMAVLTDMGLIEQPHTSAGRMPTNMGYREYVNNLMKENPLSLDDRQFIYSLLSESADEPEHLLETASQLLAELTHFVAVAKIPNNSDASIRYLQFIITGRFSGMLILMTSSGAIKNKGFRTDYTLTPEIIRIYQAVFNKKFGGMNLTSITPAFVRKIAVSLGEFSDLLKAPLAALVTACREALEIGILLEGQTNLLYIPGFELDTAKRVLNFLDAQENIAKLIADDIEEDDIQIFIGGENPSSELSESTMVISRYNLGSQNSKGAFALIGPTRMDYSASISRLKFLTDTVCELLEAMLFSDE